MVFLSWFFSIKLFNCSSSSSSSGPNCSFLDLGGVLTSPCNLSLSCCSFPPSATTSNPQLCFPDPFRTPSFYQPLGCPLGLFPDDCIPVILLVILPSPILSTCLNHITLPHSTCSLTLEFLLTSSFLFLLHFLKLDFKNIISPALIFLLLLSKNYLTPNSERVYCKQSCKRTIFNKVQIKNNF